MKRFFLLFLTLVVVFASFFVPVSADGWTSPYNHSVFNVLDFATPNNSLDLSTVVNNGDTVVFDISNDQQFSYVDILIQYNGYGINSAFLGSNELNVIKYGNGFIRLYGTFTPTVFDNFNLVLYTSGTSYIHFYKFIASNVGISPVGITGSFTWERFTNSAESGTLTQSSFNDSVFIVKPAVSNNIYNSPFSSWKIFVTAPDWTKYDYLTFLIGTDLSINSIDVSGSFGSLPYTVNEVALDETSSYVSFKQFFVTVDISSYPKDTGSIPTIGINASQDCDYPGSFYLYSVTGDYSYYYEDPEVSYLRKLFLYSNNWWSWLIENLTSLGTSVSNGFSNVVTVLGSVRDSLYIRLSNIFDSINSNFTDLKDYLTPKFTQIGTWIFNLRDSLYSRLGSILDVLKSDSSSNNQAAEDFNNSVETQAQELEDLSDTMNSVERPDISDVKLGVSDLVDPNSFTLSTVGFSSLLGMDIFTRIIIMALTFALIGFVLFGKR